MNPPDIDTWMQCIRLVGVTNMSKEKKDYVGDRIREWFENQVRERTFAALKVKEKQFEIDHADDTDDQLIAYIRQCAEEIGHSPCKEEVIGGKFLTSRFGGWMKLIIAAGLSTPKDSRKPERRKIYKEEYKLQTKLLKKEFKDNREARKERREEQAAIGQAEKAARIKRDMAWGAEHNSDADEQLLEYIRQCAAELGHSPYTKEVVGGAYISRRFGGWAVVLSEAGLPMAKGMAAPTQAQLSEYKKKVGSR